MRATGVAHRRILATAVAGVVLLTTGGCSGDDESSGPRADPSQSLLEPGEAPTLAVEPVTASGRLVGRLPRKDRRRVEQAVAGVAVRWLDDAYLGGRYPRRQFRNSFAVFTGAARAAARRDLGRLTNARIGTRVEGVTPTRVDVRVDLLALGGRAVTGTAHVNARFRTEGRLDGAFRVDGRLMMTRQERRWRVFAYDVARARVDGRSPQKQGAPGKKQKDTNRGRGGRA